MAEKKKSECISTYCHIMKKKHWRAALFDWQFESGGRLSERPGILRERQCFEEMLNKLNFEIYSSAKETRSLSKTDFLKELQRFKELCASEPCGCILMSISSHGDIEKTEDQKGSKSCETFEDIILTHQERVPIREIIEMFKDERLKQIPKIFFIQACRAEKSSTTEIDTGVHLGGEIENEFQYQDDLNIAHSTPYLEHSAIVYSTPFGYSAGFNDCYGSHVWDVLETKLKEMVAQVPINGPVNLLDWLKETNRSLAKSEGYKINDIKYKPLLSICHTLTKNIIFDTNNG